MTDQQTIIAPIVHRNGTAKEDLLEQAIDARRAVREAVRALQEAYPNGRDYYVSNDPLAYSKAQAQHDAWAEALEVVQRGLGELAIQIDSQR